MWFRKKESVKDIEMSGMMEEPPVGKKKKASTAPEETDYLPFDWKRVFFSAKYLRKTVRLHKSQRKLLTRGKTAWHILFILIGIATIIITIKHDEVVEVRFVASLYLTFVLMT
jgi:hypothetical protein